MHPNRSTSATDPRRSRDLGQLAAAAQLVGMVSVWLALAPVIPVYAGGVWAGQVVRRRLALRA